MRGLLYGHAACTPTYPYPVSPVAAFALRRCSRTNVSPQIWGAVVGPVNLCSTFDVAKSRISLTSARHVGQVDCSLV